MYIWNIECLVGWSSSVPGEDNWVEDEDYVLCAENFTKAISKLNKLALAKSRTLREVDDLGIKVVFKPITIEDITKVERGDYIDG